MFLDTIPAGIAVPVIMSKLSSRTLVTMRNQFLSRQPWVLTADDIAVITHIVTTTMASMPMQQQAATAPHPEGARRVVDERHWMEGLLFPVQGSLLCWTELEQSDIDPLDGYATAWRLVCPGHLLHIEDLCSDTSAEIR